jgi:hypothetical protein
MSGKKLWIIQVMPLCWLLRTTVQKKREMCQEHYEGTTLSCWIPEPSPEKGEGANLFRPLLLGCFFGEASQAMKWPSLRSVKEEPCQERYLFLACRRHLRSTVQGTDGLPFPRGGAHPSGTIRLFTHPLAVKRFYGNRDANHPGLARRGSCHHLDVQEQAHHIVLESVARCLDAVALG